MCGIAGISSLQPVAQEKIRAMAGCMVRRGPEAEGIHVFPGTPSVGFGHRRLKIIDLSDSANQPMFNDNQSVGIVFNGEIYNFKELRQTYLSEQEFKTNGDTEVIIKMYEKFGIDCVKYLRGIFAFALYDQKTKKLFLVRDHLGKKPLLYAINGQTLYFSSSIAAIANVLPKTNLNTEILKDYLNYNYIPTTETVYTEIQRLPPGTILTWSNNQAMFSKFWEIDFTKKNTDSFSEIVQKSESLIDQAVRRRLISDVPLGAFLSGGVDSGLIVAKMAAHGSVRTFSMGFEQADFNELPYAKLTARKYNTQHTEFIVKPELPSIMNDLLTAYEEPFADPSMIPMHYLCKLTKQQVTVVLNGDGGDEGFAGYERYLGPKYVQIMKLLPSPLRRLLLAAIRLAPENTAHRSFLRRLKWLLTSANLPAEEVYLSLFRKKIFDDSGKSDTAFLNCYSKQKLQPLDQMLYTDINTYLPEDLLVKADRAAMYHSLEGRSPLLDVDLLKYTATIPAALKTQHGLKSILKTIAKKHIPAEVLNKPKQGFGVPLGSWFRNELKTVTQDLLVNSQIAKLQITDQTTIDRLVSEHVHGKTNHGRTLFNFVMLESWLQKQSRS
jgi:asparagine synthase (glutamine-hydrolysing)